MCGIAGIISPAASHHRPRLQRMIEALRHRGPDATAILEFPDALLGHTRQFQRISVAHNLVTTEANLL